MEERQILQLKLRMEECNIRSGFMVTKFMVIEFMAFVYWPSCVNSAVSGQTTVLAHA